MSSQKYLNLNLSNVYCNRIYFSTLNCTEFCTKIGYWTSLDKKWTVFYCCDVWVYYAWSIYKMWNSVKPNKISSSQFQTARISLGDWRLTTDDRLLYTNSGAAVSDVWFAFVYVRVCTARHMCSMLIHTVRRTMCARVVDYCRVCSVMVFELLDLLVRRFRQQTRANIRTLRQ